MSDSRTFSETTNHIKELKFLLDQGILSQDEYEQQKNALLFPDGLPTPAAEAQPQQALNASQNSDEKTTATDSPAEKKNTSDKQFDEIIAFKKLLENGVITQNEFNQKKEELLGISPSTPSQKKDCCQTYHQDSGFNNHCIRNCPSYGAPSGPKLWD